MELLAQPISGGKIGSAPPRDLSKAGYVRLALYKFGPNTPLQHFKNAYHLVCYSHIIQKVNVEGSSAKDSSPRAKLAVISLLNMLPTTTSHLNIWSQMDQVLRQ